MKKKFRWGLLLLAILIIAITAFLYIQSKPQKSAAPPSTAANVLKFEVTREDLSSSLEIKGKSSYVKETFIYAPFSADVTEWKVAEGSEVKKNDVLFTLDSRPLQNEITQLHAALQKMQLEAKLRDIEKISSNSWENEPLSTTEQEVLKRLAQKQSHSVQLELEQINMNISQHQISEREEKLQKASFTAPEDGIFLFVNQKEPKIVRENDLLGKIVDLSQLQLISTVGEYDVFQIQPGMSVDVRVDALRQVRLQGIVTHVSKFARETSAQNTGAAQFEIIISLEPNDKLIAGLGLTGTIETEKRTGALVIPSLTVYKERDTTYVYVQDEHGAISRKEITIGMETAEKTEVIEGLKEGDIVVLQ